MRKTVLITGGTRGIGRACVEKFAREGWDVVFCFVKSTAAAQTLCTQYHARAVQADVSSPGEVGALFQTIQKEYGRLDAVVANAAVAEFSLFTEITAEQWDRMFAVNVKGTFLCLKEAAKLMIPQKSGSLITVSSMWGQTGGSCEVHYSASKAAVIGLTKALAKELGPSGIRVNCIAPGVIDTDMNAALDREALLAIAGETPLGRIGRPAEAADAAYFLAGEGSSFITGQVLSVGGGIVI